MRQPIVSDGTAHIFCEETEFIAEHQATLTHNARCEGVVIVGGNVPINGLRVIQAQIRAHAQCRNQQTALAFSAHREKCVWSTQHGKSRQMKAHVMSGGHVGGLINGERIGFNPPGLAAGFAGRQCGLMHLCGLTVFKSRVFTFTLDTTGGVFIRDVLHFTGFGLNLIIELGPCKANPGARNHGVAFDIHRVG